MIYSLGTKQNLELLAYCVQSQSNDISGGKKKKKSTVFIAENQVKRTGSSCLKDQHSLMTFREEFLEANSG